MTYSLIEKEATIYEQQIDELFNLTELDAKRASKGWEDNPTAPEFLDYKGDLQKTIKYKGRDLTQYQLAVAKDAEASSHWSDVYKRPKSVKPMSHGLDTITPNTITHEPVVAPPTQAEIDAARIAATVPVATQVVKRVIYPRTHHPDGKFKNEPELKKKPSKVVVDKSELKKKPSKVVVKNKNEPELKKKPLVKVAGPESRVTGKVVDAKAQKAKEKFMADAEAKEEIKRKAAERKAAKAKLAEEQRKIKELEKKIAAEKELKKKNALETELKKQLADADDLELKAEKERIAREVELRKTAEAKAEKIRLELAEAKAKREGKLKLAEELRIKKMKATVALSGAEKLALRAGATQAEILSTQLDVTGNLSYQDVVPEPVKGNPVEIPKERLSNAQKYALKTKTAARVAEEHFTQLQKNGKATAAELAAAEKEFKRASLDSLNARKQHELLQANNAGVAQSTKAKAEVTRLETKIMKQEAELVTAKRQGTPAKISTITQKLENAKIEQKIALDAQQSLKDAKIKNVPSLAIKIQPGDDLTKIGKRYGVTVNELLAANPSIVDKDLIIAGEKLNIPVKGSNAFLPGTKFSKSQIDNILTQKQQSLIKPGEAVWIDNEGNIRSSAKINDPTAINLSDPPKSNLALPTEPDFKITTTPDEPDPSKIKKGIIGVIPNAEAKRMGWERGAEIKIKNGKAMLQLPGGRPMYISNADANRILSAMGKPPTLVGNIARKSLTTAGAMLKGAGRLATGAVFGYGLKGEIISTVVMTSAMMYGSSRMLRNIDAEQKRMELKLPGNALSQLSPAQYLGGYGNMGRWHDATQDQMGGTGKKDTGGIWSSDKMIAELLSHDDVITRTLENTTPKNLKDLKDSFMNMTKEDADVYRHTFRKDGKINKEFLEDNIVTVMDEAGVLRRITPWGLGEPGESGQDDWHNNPGIMGQGIQGKDKMTPLEMMNLIVQPGAVIQIIPTHERVGPKQHRRELSKDERTTNMKTVRLHGENTNEFTDIQHYVSDKVERGGRIVVDGEEKYIPTRKELDVFLMYHTESIIPSDWHLGFKDLTVFDKKPGEGDETYKRRIHRMSKAGRREYIGKERPTTPEEWMRSKQIEPGSARAKVSTAFLDAGPDMTDQEKITWWKGYREKHKIKPSSSWVGKDKLKGDWGGKNYFDMASDWIGKKTGLWEPGAATDPRSKLTYIEKEDLEGKLTASELAEIYDEYGQLKSDIRPELIAKIKEPPPEGVDTTLNFGPVGGESEDEEEIKDFVTSKELEWVKPMSPGAYGRPATVEGYDRLMASLANKYASFAGVSPNEFKKLLKTLAHSESGMISLNGKYNKGYYRGDKHLGKEGSFGAFHVRWGHYKPGAVNEYNNAHGTTYSWKDIAGKPGVSADIGAWFYAKLLKDTEGNYANAYGIYNGGPRWLQNEMAQKNVKNFGNNFKNYYMNESINYMRKSAILEGIAKAA